MKLRPPLSYLVELWRYARSCGLWSLLLLIQTACPRMRIVRESNAVKVSSETAKHHYVYAAMGASDTQGAGASDYKHGYVAILHKWLKTATGHEWRLINVGRSGARITDLAKRQLALVVRAQPHVVTIWTGGNDVRHHVHPRSFERWLAYILCSLRTKTEAVIAIANLPEMQRQPFAKSLPLSEREWLKRRVDVYNQIISRLAKHYDATLVDLSRGSLMYEPSNFSSDGLHPNDRGYVGIAERFFEAIELQLQSMKGERSNEPIGR
ncbi:MAG TPA: SGNH/GDSL hydrolase family protein [Armatimonadetes bacterium]|nr:SGNH/GDSL hydrolase family protein [Armatimonadota bacterium]